MAVTEIDIDVAEIEPLQDITVNDKATTVAFMRLTSGKYMVVSKDRPCFAFVEDDRSKALAKATRALCFYYSNVTQNRIKEFRSRKV